MLGTGTCTDYSTAHNITGRVLKRVVGFMNIALGAQNEKRHSTHNLFIDDWGSESWLPDEVYDCDLERCRCTLHRQALIGITALTFLEFQVQNRISSTE